MIRRPPRSTRTDTLFPYPTLFRSKAAYRCDILRREVPVRGKRRSKTADFPPTHRIGLAGNREGRCARLSDATSRQMDTDDRIHLIGATQRLVDALAEQCDRARRGGEQVKEALEIGRGQIRSEQHKSEQQY